MSEHDWLGIAVGTAVGALLGYLIAGYFYLKSKRKIQLTCSMDKTQLLGRERGVLPEEVMILYRDTKITDLVKFNAIFWNSGNVPIRRHHVTEPMLLCLSNTSNLLKASVLKSSRPQNRAILHAVNDTQKIQVDFEYLEPRQGFNVELLVTGEITDDPIPTGNIIGMPGGFRKFDAENRRRIASRIVLFSFIGVFVGFVVTITVFNVSDNTAGGPVLGAALLSALIPVFGVLWPQGIFRRQGIPPDLHT